MNIEKNDKRNRDIFIIIILVIILIAILIIDLILNKDSNQENISKDIENNITTNIQEVITTTNQVNIQDNTTMQNTTRKSSYEDYMLAATMEYTCTNGYEFDGSLCIKKTITEPKSRYYCTSGVQEGDYCVREVHDSVYISSSAKANCTNYSNTGLYQKCLCEKSGGTWGVGGCYTIKKEKTLGTSEDYCDPVYSYENNKCIKIDYEAPKLNYKCPDGYRISGALCFKE